jgi:hypothetical protein
MGLKLNEIIQLLVFTADLNLPEDNIGTMKETYRKFNFALVR